MGRAESGDGAAAGSVNEELTDFSQWLDRQRGLAPVTIDNYCWNVERFLRTLPPPAAVSVALLDAGVITGFMIDFCRGRNVNSAKSMARSVRAFLRFAHATGRTSNGLWGAVPAPASWHLASLPRAVPPGDVDRLLSVAAHSGFTVSGRRNYAILQLLARLGLRRGEVAALTLDDIDWRSGEITITGKGARLEGLPLLAQVGDAIAAWLEDGRPQCRSRAVFTTLRPAGYPLTAGAIGHIVRTASRTAGVAQFGAHRLRHTLATEMLRAGASLPEVGQVLRHRSAMSTAIYAKVDESALRPLARQWPGTSPTAITADERFRHLARTWPGARS